MPLRIEDILALKDSDGDKKLLSTKVEKPIDCELDVGELLLSDPNALELYKMNDNREEYVKNIVRENVQLLVNKIFEIPIEVREDLVVVKLPKRIVRLPREKPCPKPKAPTRWEEYRLKKGLKVKKKEKLVWDEAQQKWLPRYGYKRINNLKDDWILPVPEGADPMEDQFKIKSDQKKERVAKNEFQRLRNVARANKISTKAVSAVPPTQKVTPELAAKAAAVAKVSTASMGKFDKKLALEKEAKIKGKKRKFDDNLGSLSKEKERAMKILKEIDHGRPKLNFGKVVEKQMKQDIQEEIQSKRAAKRGTKSSKRMGNKKAAIKMAKVNRIKGKAKGGKGKKRR